MKVIVEPTDKVVALGALQAGVYVVDGDEPWDCGVVKETHRYLKNTPREVCNVTHLFVLRTKLLSLPGGKLP